jgi:hypothetical protein
LKARIEEIHFNTELVGKKVSSAMKDLIGVEVVVINGNPHARNHDGVGVYESYVRHFGL